MTREEAMYLLNNLRSVAEGKEDEAIDMAIEALSANYTTEKPNDEVEQKNDIVDRPTGEWIPCSDGLPQRVGSYIVTYEDEHGSIYVDYDFWTVTDEFKYNGAKVIAWIPFPEPYCCSYGERKDNIT